MILLEPVGLDSRDVAHAWPAGSIEYLRRFRFFKGAVRRSIKLANFCGHGLVAKENKLMKSLNHDTRHLSRRDRDDKKWQTMRTLTLLCSFIF